MPFYRQKRSSFYIDSPINLRDRGFMKDKLEKLEEIINVFLMAIWTAIISFVHGLIPQKFFDSISSFKSKIKDWKIKKFEQFTKLLNDLKSKSITSKTFLINQIDSIQKYPIKEKFQVHLTILKEYLLNTPLKTHVLWVSKRFNKYSTSFWKAVDKVGRQQLGLALTAMLMIVVGILSIYDSSRDIYNNEYRTRAPASVQQYDDKPDYKMYKRKTAVIFKIQVPIYREKLKQVRNITIDFTIRTSTRFAKQYMEFHAQKLKDYFFTSVEPVTSSFPLEEEGKIVLKEKIQYELNNFLMNENVEGVVEDISIIYSMGY